MGHKQQRTAMLVLASALVVGAAGCATKTINDVLADPARYRNREVQISGDVINSYSVVGRGVYQVRDRTGQLWIMSTEGVPRTGARVRVKGTIREGLNLGSFGGNLPAGIGLMMVESSHDVQ